ncbi:Piso0_003383 [Millerozyma farinosa CBS 7064]|uniref:Piso0_003383 protein n=1 Tax=Pichia sorbitophila (strain ATCC MYA-4447 / BCRC 22081 / CBS 7064 / NBRC 10061 / NRRL Y-12695) TaxID=559304 RepID=G8YHY6_PICSO|nr:Piso0_003383 [Millerozyma farinosa CBS 7064]CCE81038.1 Piso0_003383 [Millerozyma farinosa CBS 7064]
MSLGIKVAQQLDSKILLITGASSGIGEATAREFAAASYGKIKLILTARRENKLIEIAKSIKEEYPDIRIHTAKLDISDTEKIEPFIKGLPEEFSDIDILVNNAGKALGRNYTINTAPQHVDEMFKTNVLGMISMTQAVLPIFKKKNRGDIVNIGSIAARETYPGGSIYCATKASVRSFTSVLRKELINTKIRVIELDPGAVDTEFFLVRFGGDQEQARKVFDGIEPMSGQDIAEAIIFSVSRKPNTVIAEMLMFPTNQADTYHVYKSENQ